MSHEAGSESGGLWSDGDDEATARRCRSLQAVVDGAVFEVDADARFVDVGRSHPGGRFNVLLYAPRRGAT